MIEFTSIIPMPEEKTPLSSDWAAENFDLTYQSMRNKHYLIEATKDCFLSWFMNEDGSEGWILEICFAVFNVKYIEEVDYLIKTFYVKCKRNDILDE